MPPSGPRSPSDLLLGKKRKEPESPLNVQIIVEGVRDVTGVKFTSYMKYKRLLAEIESLATFCDLDDTKELFMITAQLNEFKTERAWANNQIFINDEMLDLKALKDRLVQESRNHAKAARAHG